MTSFITIGCQSGGPECGVVGRLKVELYHALGRKVTSTHCPAIDSFALVLRVDGSLDKFGEEGFSRLRFARAKRYITVDIQIPESVWKPLTEWQLKAYLVAQVKSAIDLCVARLRHERLFVDDRMLRLEVDAAAIDYMSASV